jgi:hypothetical protein
MKKRFVAMAVTAVVVVAFVCWHGKHQKTNEAQGSTNHVLAFPHEFVPSPGGTSRTTSTNMGLEEKVTPYSSYVGNMKIASVSGGNRGVIEIDHGLPKQLVDTPEMRRGVNRGLSGAITLRVVDSDGHPVQGAELFGGFWNYDRNDPPATGLTDENGEIHLEHNCAGDLNFSIKKDGYYKSVFRYWFFKNGYNCVKDGRWIPWNPTVEVFLKEKKKPTDMISKTFDRPIPAQGSPIGVDLRIGDWVSPFGKGVHSDVQLQYQRSQNNDTGKIRDEFSILFTNVSDGAYMARKDIYSTFKSPYVADDEAEYLKEYHYMVEGKSRKQMGADELMVFRSRSILNANGSFNNAHYGVIYGDIQFALGRNRSVRFFYMFNPSPNDRTIEPKGLF